MKIWEDKTLIANGRYVATIDSSGTLVTDALTLPAGYDVVDFGFVPTDILSTPHTHEPIPERDLRKKTNDLVNELVSSIEIIQNSGLSTHNIFKIIGMFLEKYEDLYEQIEEEVDCCGVDEQQTDTTDINNPSFDDENEDDSALMLRDSSKNTKNNYLERFNKIFEILRESENGEINQQSGNGSTDTTTSGRTETELEHKNKRQTSEGQHTESLS